MKAHDLAKELLRCENSEITLSIDISTCDSDSGRRLFTDDYIGINNLNGDEIVLLFSTTLTDNFGNTLK